MQRDVDRLREGARIALAGIRLVNGIAALVAPGFLARRLNVDPAANPSLLYVFRMFGIRTILVAIDLLRPDEARRAAAVRAAVPIHASDTLAALIASSRGQPRTTVLISALNTALAVLAQPRRA